MKNITKNLKDGQIEVAEIPCPILNNGQVLVQNYYSVISAGTEGKSLSDARLGYIAKAKARQKEVKLVINKVKSEGLLSTIKVVKNKLESPSRMGYACVGRVLEVSPDVNDFKTGDIVACGGAGANHAEIVAVPVNLCVKVPENVEPKDAVYTTLASIAVQGIRQADLSLGSNAVVIGLGIIGQLTMLMLEAAGVKSIGVDIDNKQVEFARSLGLERVYQRDTGNMAEIIKELTGGYGCDAVIITAGTSSLDPVNFAGKIARKKGNVVIVGAVPTGFDRADYYQKELTLKMSTSYGPGRYDLNYEEKGIDYPVGYVRWTENRNMGSFIDLLAQKKLNVEKLTTHVYSLDEAPKAYDMILGKQEHFSGVLIKYDEKPDRQGKIVFKNLEAKSGRPAIGFIGAGSFAQNVLLPRLKGADLVGIVTSNGNNSRYVAKKYGFNYCADSVDDLVNDEKINTVFIVTRHNLHAEYVIKALKVGKNVFVEKPLAMTKEELEEIREICSADGPGPMLFVGFNRRFSPAVQKIKSVIDDSIPKSINIRINAGILPAGHWVNDPEIGGGRIVGEGCHFVDLAMYLAGGKIEKINAFAMEDAAHMNNTVSANLKFDNGSVASITYFSNGNPGLPKERIEVFSGGTVAVVDDFKVLHIYGKSTSTVKYKGQDKGHAEELKRFVDAIKNGGPSPIPFGELYQSTLATFYINESISSGSLFTL